MFATGPRRCKGLEFVCVLGHDAIDDGLYIFDAEERLAFELLSIGVQKSSGSSNLRRLRYPLPILEANAQVDLSHQLRCVEPAEILLCNEKQFEDHRRGRLDLLEPVLCQYSALLKYTIKSAA